MRFSSLFGRTLREAPADAELVSHQLAVRAGLIRQMAAGIYSYLPLGWRVLRNIEQIMREEMEALDGQEVSLPIVQPAEIWRATGRYQAASPGPALVRFQDRTEHDLVLAMTHEEAVADLARQVIASHRQLPIVVYQFQLKFRDEPRARGGVIRTREFLMKDAYSLHADYASLDTFYERIYQAYRRIFARCGVEALPVEADTGMMGGVASHEFMVVSESGEDTLLLCSRCRYAANVETAQIGKGAGITGPEAPIERIATPNTHTIQGLADLLGISPKQTLKAVFYSTEQGQVIFAVIRGDLYVNPIKLAHQVGASDLHSSTEDELRAAGIVAGYASPVGLTGMRVIADDSILTGNNYVAGANEPHYHLKNVNYPRDFAVETIADIALARAGDTCSRCGAPLSTTRGIEAGHTFKLGAKYGQSLGATYLDRDSVAQPIVMGSYGIGLGRLMACIIEQHHDDKGIIWPVSVAPYQIYLIVLGANKPDIAEAGEALYQRLQRTGYQVLYDDRSESAGVKFNDADLLGIPVRLTLSARTMAIASVELKERWAAAPRSVLLDDLDTEIGLALQDGRPIPRQ